MEKRDIAVIVVAIFIVLFMAMYIKPLVTGKPVELIPEEISNFFGGKNETHIINDTPILNETPIDMNASPNEGFDISQANTTSTTTPTPSPTPTWNGSPVSVGLQSSSEGSYIYPRLYPELSDPRYSFSQPSLPLITYATFPGEYSAISNTFYIPANYWELWYTINVKEDLGNPTITTGSARVKNEDGTYSYQERMDSISVINPYFSIVVRNADTKNDIRNINIPGGINPRLWKGEFSSPDPITFEGDFKPKSPNTIDGTYNWDPRPWKEKFFEGNKNYQLDIDARNIISYSIEIKVPDPKYSPINDSSKINETDISRLPGKIMENVFNSYIEDSNLNISQPEIFGAIIQNLSVSVLEKQTNDEIFRQITNMKNAGIMLSEFERTSIFFRGPEGSLKGYLTYNSIIGERKILIDIPFILQYNGWKMDDLPLIKT
jgi:hypothetical protein